MEPGDAAPLCVFILGTWYLCLGVVKGVFGYGCAVFVLVTKSTLRMRWPLSPGVKTADMIPGKEERKHL